jgi:hypothetical protein
VRELRAISHSDRKSDKVETKKLARYARLDLHQLRLGRDGLGNMSRSGRYIMWNLGN